MFVADSRPAPGAAAQDPLGSPVRPLPSGWNQVDRKTSRTQLTDVEGELNDLLSYDRVPKVDAAATARVDESFLRA